MRGKAFIQVLAAPLLLAALAGTGCRQQPPQSSSQSASLPPGLAALLTPPKSAFDANNETKSRITPDDLNALAAGPNSEVDAGDLAKAETDLEVLLKTRQADTITSFGLALYRADKKQEALAYLARAIPAYRSAFGPKHPEVALALQTWADAQLDLTPDAPPLTVDRAFEEAYQIRLAALGPDNAETLTNEFKFAKLKGLPARTHGVSARIAAAASLFEQTVEALKHCGRATPHDYGKVYTALAVMYARNGQTEAAISSFDKAVQAVGRGPDGAPSEALPYEDLREALAGDGHKKEADELVAKYHLEPVSAPTPAP